MRTLTTKERLWAKAEFRPSGCVEYTGTRNPGGYGQLEIQTEGGRWAVLAHRLSFELTNGPIPSGLIVRHSCDNPPCVKPTHLLLGTRADNTQDAVDRNRLRMPPRNAGEAHPQARLTERNVRDIRARYSYGNGGDLAGEYGVSRSMISAIVNRQTWRHI